MPKANVFTVNNFTIPATPPGQFVPGTNGAAVPAGHDTWALTIDTTGLLDNQLLCDVVVQYHYTSVQLGVTGLANQGQVTNTDGTVTQITGGTFTGWIDDTATTLRTSRLDRAGNVVKNASLGADMKRIINAYPDAARFCVTNSPGYTHVPAATFDLN